VPQVTGAVALLELHVAFRNTPQRTGDAEVLPFSVNHFLIDLADDIGDRRGLADETRARKMGLKSNEVFQDLRPLECPQLFAFDAEKAGQLLKEEKISVGRGL